MPMLAEVNTSRPPIEKARSARPECGTRWRWPDSVVELVQENRELVSAQPGERISLPQARLETTRRCGEQLVAHRVAEAVVDDLEAVKIEIERRESAAAALCFELLEAASETLHEDGAVAKAGQRIAESRAAEALRFARSLGRRSQSIAMRAMRRPAPRTATPRHRNRR